MNRPDVDLDSLFSLSLSVAAHRAADVLAVAAAVGGHVVIAEQHDDQSSGVSRFALRTDGEATLRRLGLRLRVRLGRDLIDLRDPVFARAQRGKIAQRLTVPLASADDVDLIHPRADARVRDHLAAHPDAVDQHTGRRRRVALVSDASALPAGTDPAAALVGLESAAAFLHHHTGLDIAPLPVDPRRASLADVVTALSPGFAAVCVHHTLAEHTDEVRRRLRAPRPGVPVLDTGDDAAAVTLAAATLNALRLMGLPPHASRITVVGAHTAPGIGALLTAAGVRDLTFAQSHATLPDPAEPPDVLIDLSATDAADPGAALVLPSLVPGRPGDPHPPHPLLALPGLLTAAVQRRAAVDVTARLAVAHALADLAAPGHLLPDPLDLRITATVNAAVAGLPRQRRP